MGLFGKWDQRNADTMREHNEMDQSETVSPGARRLWEGLYNVRILFAVAAFIFVLLRILGVTG